MSLLRLYLLSGLVLHKLVWEVLKRRQVTIVDNAAGRNQNGSSMKLRVIKKVKIAILVGIAVQTLVPPILPITSTPLLLQLFGTLIYTAGLIIAIRGRWELGTNWSDIEAAQVLKSHSVVNRGLYRFIRHPIYVGDLMLLLGLELAMNSWLVIGVLLLIPIVLRQAISEESKLADALPGYSDYCAQTKRFIPFVV